MATVVERERKYSGDEGFRLPDLTGCGGVATTSDATALDLDAVYLDTADLRLARGGFALRRRTGGHDAGWHLKVGATGGPRTEYQFPAGPEDTDPPAELVALFRAASRGRPVAPAARIVTRRRETRLLDPTGRTLAEVAEDSVEAHDLVGGERQAWHEIEVELVDGDEALLDAVDARLRAAGAWPVPVSKSQRALASRLAAARPAPADPGAAPVLDYATAQRDALIGNHPGARSGDEDAVHDMRVAVRRLRSTLRTFRGLWDRRASEWLRGELRWLAGHLGPVRDTQVMAARLADAVRAEPDELVLGPVAARLAERFAADLATALDDLRTALDSDRYTELLRRLDALLEGPTTRTVDARWVARRVRRAVTRADERLDRALAAGTGAVPERAVDRSGRDAGPDHPGGTDNIALHEARKAAKAARYAVEVREPAAGQPASRLVARLKELQDLLGAHQDSTVTREVLRRQALRAYANGEHTFTYGLLHARQAAAADRELPGLVRARDRARRRKVRRWLKRAG
ncbi:CYTH and CHAD domain-containing protein [Micromonospora sp. DR5-3]|uniref:CYTH and CHAD domain-containing protein n=1 Tax=unclassified Micromonospora TaxID=2617518 RepID=UPI0011D80560|nr:MULTISPECIES: CYTH and CHAD domain-containing protein [unclassified Micromonospora]MCW3814617.1 CYTH and CHAD domain-containing protein [Micromonospora sp. DR5-3]TYC22523.1 CYTH and CHAD domain-containing protein [Micromonospora sp. MP36]